MLNKTGHYPYAEVKRIFETCYNCSISQFMKQIKPIISYRAAAVKFSAIPFLGQSTTPIVLDDLNLNDTIIGLMTMNLTAFLLMDDAEEVFSRITEWAAKTHDCCTIETVEMLVSRVKNVGNASLSSIAYLAYYEAHLYRTQLLSDQNIILPDPTECQTLLNLATRASSVLSTHSGVVYRPTLDGAYNAVVSRGGPDFLSDDAIWAIRFRKGVPTINDHMYLLITYVVAKRADRYAGKPPRYIRVLNLVEGIVYSADMWTTDPMLLRIIQDCVYGPEFADPSITVLDKSKQARLVMAMISLLDAYPFGKEALIAEINKQCPFPDDIPNLWQLQEPVIRQFINFQSDGETDERLKKAILALNQLYYHSDYPDTPTGITVTLSEDLLSDLLEKTLAY